MNCAVHIISVDKNSSSFMILKIKSVFEYEVIIMQELIVNEERNGLRIHYALSFHVENK